MFGHSVWIDEAEINIGDSLIGKIREGLDEVDFVAAVLSKHSTVCYGAEDAKSLLRAQSDQSDIC